jgi:hypothetical protein
MVKLIVAFRKFANAPKNGVGEACSTHWWKKEVHKKVSTGKSERDHLEYPRLDGRIILKLILKYWDGVEWIDLARIGDRFLKTWKIS